MPNFRSLQLSSFLTRSHRNYKYCHYAHFRSLVKTWQFILSFPTVFLDDHSLFHPSNRICWFVQLLTMTDCVIILKLHILRWFRVSGLYLNLAKNQWIYGFISCILSGSSALDVPHLVLLTSRSLEVDIPLPGSGCRNSLQKTLLKSVITVWFHGRVTFWGWRVQCYFLITSQITCIFRFSQNFPWLPIQVYFCQTMPWFVLWKLNLICFQFE